MNPILQRRCYRRSNSTLRLVEEPICLQDPFEVLIKIDAVSLNLRDANILHGTNPGSVIPSGIPCSDAVGAVIQVGSKVRDFKIGDVVSPIFDQRAITGHEQEREWLGGDVDGVLATHCVFPESKLVRIPDHLTWSEAACLPCAGLTAWSGLTAAGGLCPGMSVLIQGTGAVSMMALKLALESGCRVMLTSSSDKKLRQIKDHYTTENLLTINYASDQDWDMTAVALNENVGVDIVIENGGTQSLMKSMKATRRGGTVSQVGYLAKQNVNELQGLLPLLIDKKINLKGINVGSKIQHEALNRAVSVNRTSFLDIIDRTFSFDQAQEAFDYLWSGKYVGKIVIRVS